MSLKTKMLKIARRMSNVSAKTVEMGLLIWGFMFLIAITLGLSTNLIIDNVAMNAVSSTVRLANVNCHHGSKVDERCLVIKNNAQGNLKSKKFEQLTLSTNFDLDKTTMSDLAKLNEKRVNVLDLSSESLHTNLKGVVDYDLSSSKAVNAKFVNLWSEITYFMKLPIAPLVVFLLFGIKAILPKEKEVVDVVEIVEVKKD